jgi:hypothetical protein
LTLLAHLTLSALLVLLVHGSVGPHSRAHGGGEAPERGHANAADAPDLGITGSAMLDVWDSFDDSKCVSCKRENLLCHCRGSHWEASSGPFHLSC